MKHKLMTESFGVIGLILLFPFFLAPQSPGEEYAQAIFRPDWAKAKAAFNKFVSEPSSLTAREFFLTISDGNAIKGDKTEILDHIFGQSMNFPSSGRYPGIAIEMLHNNIYAARSAIKLLDFIENGWQKPRRLTTILGIFVGGSLGDLIRVNPALFLRACHEEREDPYIKEKGFPVGIIPIIMSKKTMASYELEMRREALSSVDDPELRSIRDECIEILNNEIEKCRPDNPNPEENDARSLDEPKVKVGYAIAEMQRRPSPENMKRVLDLLGDGKGAASVDVMRVMLPPFETYMKAAPDKPFDVVLREARCGNEYAVELAFRTLVHVFGLPSMEICSELSNLILSKPALFIEKLAKYEGLLDSVNSLKEPDRVISLHYFEWTCNFVSPFDYKGDCKSTIYRRRIDTLAALNMPEHKELIDRCIRVIEKEVK